MKIGNGGKLKKLNRRFFKLFLKARKKMRRKRKFALCLGVSLGLISLLIVGYVVLLPQDRTTTTETAETVPATGEQEESGEPLSGERGSIGEEESAGEETVVFTAEQQYWLELAELKQANSRKWKINLNPLGEISFAETGKWLRASSWEIQRMKRKTLSEAPFYEEKTIGGRIKKWFQGIFISVAEQAEILKDRRRDAKTLLTLEEAIPNAWPVKGARISSRFGWRRNPFTKRGSEFHSGLDLAASSGTKVRAAGGGVVTFAGYKSTWGNMIRISHGHGYVSQYAHNSLLLVNKGDRVERGQVIATVGRTGRATGPHLHFGVSKDGKWIDPLVILKK
jgi:murein DD-endopeptidase MepM/ murein hydrolase activator NlpD